MVANDLNEAFRARNKQTPRLTIRSSKARCPDTATPGPNGDEVIVILERAAIGTVSLYRHFETWDSGHRLIA